MPKAGRCVGEAGARDQLVGGGEIAHAAVAGHADASGCRASSAASRASIRTGLIMSEWA